MMTTDTAAVQREAFEAYLRQIKFPVLPVWHNGKPHQNYALELMWQAWEAAFVTTPQTDGATVAPQMTGDRMRAIIKSVGSFGTNHDDAPYAYVKAGWDAALAATHAPAMADPVRVEQLRKGLFEARDAMRVMSNWVKQSDPAGHSWAVRMVDRENAVLSHAPAMAETSELVLVPKKATNAMIDAANNTPCGIAGSPPHWQWVWDAMIAAASGGEQG